MASTSTNLPGPENVRATYNNNNNLEEDSATENNNNNENAEQAKIINRTSTRSERPLNLKNRNSFHQDVNEALNSLLWQPYEYQNKQASEDSSSLSSFSSCCSLSSLDLERGPNNGPVRSERCGNKADLHLAVGMVNNLAGCGNPLSQSRDGSASRDRLTASAASRLLADVSACERCVEVVSRPTDANCDEFGGNMRVEISTLPVSPTSSNVVTTTALNRPADVETPARASIGSVVNLSHQNGAGAAAQRNSYVSPPKQQQQQHGYQRSVSSDMIPSNLNSIVSANVVGLPNHPRHASVPSSTTQIRNPAGNGFIFPNHPRNSSEPSTAVHQPAPAAVVSHTRNASTPAKVLNVSAPATTPVTTTTSSTARPNATAAQGTNISCANIVSILSHHRHSSHISSADVPAFVANSLRSASVPKAPGESSTTTLSISNSQNRIPINVSSVDVNFYRAVPVTVVSNVPTIHCVNHAGDNVSNVNIVQAMPPTAEVQAITGTTQVTVHSQSEPPESSRTRTFTSTEAQTDDTAVGTGAALVRNADRALSREQRRRERRERRHMRRVNAGHQHAAGTTRGGGGLPDLLNSHMPPPYSPNHASMNVASAAPPGVPSAMVHHSSLVAGTIVPNNVVPSGVVASHVVAFPAPVVSGQVPLVQGAPVPVPTPSGFRFPFPTAGFRRSRYSEEPPKSCCGLLAWKPGSLRWFIALIAVVAVCCVLVGTALGAMRPAGRDHLTVSLLMIGVGIVLVTVSGVAWRLTSHDSSTCRAMLGLGSTESVDVCPRRFVPRLPPSYGRPHHPYAAMIYPEFQYRPPPPSYQASMQEYRLRLLLLDRGNTPQIQAGVQNGPSPPPTYRSYAGSLLRAPLSNRRDASQSEYSFPPSYRSQTSSTRRPGTVDLQTNVIIHSREHSLSLSESNHGGSLVNGVAILRNNDEEIALDNITIDSLKMAPESEINPVKMLLKGSCGDLEGKDGNLVTIVQTSDQSPVIVTVSGCSQVDSGSTVQITEIPSEMEILAHL